jgi:hypothetical protein
MFTKLSISGVITNRKWSNANALWEMMYDSQGLVWLAYMLYDATIHGVMVNCTDGNRLFECCKSINGNVGHLTFQV